MSLILDALRKSEAERRRGSSPDLFASLPAPTPTRRPELLRLWPWFALLALGLAAASVYWIARDTQAPAASEPIGQSAVDEPADAALESDGAANPSMAPTAKVPVQPSPPPAKPSHPGIPTVQPAASAAAQPPPPPVQTIPIAVAPPAAASADQAESLPPIAILSASERASLPPLKLSMHVWNSDPAKRFAIIDGQRVGEGAVIGGAVIAEIRRDGVVLDIGGRRILLPRP